MKTIQELLQGLDACGPAKEWAKNKTIEEIVDQCHKGDWLLCLAFKMNLNFKLLILAIAKCVKTVDYLMKDQRSIDALNLTERFGLGDKVSLDDLKSAAKNARAATYNKHNDAYAAATAVTCTIDLAAVDDAAYATAVATHAITRAAAAASYAAYYSGTYDDAIVARIKNEKQTADICRETFGKKLIESINNYLKN